MLRCVSPYKSSLGAFQPGDVITSPELALALLNDSPGSFEDAAPVAEPVTVEALEDAPEHRAIKRGRKA
jgi:hypothetical protein